MLTGPDALTPENQPMASVFSWGTISFHGHLNGKLLFPDQVLKRNIEPWQIVLPNLAGCASSCKNFTARLVEQQWSTVII
jgi:hypothetical protein